MTASTYLEGIAAWATILAFVFLMVAALITPLLGSRRTEKRLGHPNGASSNSEKVEEYKDYNLYDLCLRSLELSEKASETSEKAVEIATRAHRDIVRILKLLYKQ